MLSEAEKETDSQDGNSSILIHMLWSFKVKSMA